MEKAHILARPSPGLTEAIVSVHLLPGEKKETMIFSFFKKMTNMKSWQSIGETDGILEMVDSNIRNDLKPSSSIDYMVIIKNKTDGAVINVLQTTMSYKVVDKYALISAVNYEKMLTATDSQEFAIFHRSLQGPVCTTCWDDVRKESSNEDCESCGGTGFQDGFEWVGKTRFALLNSNSAEVLTNEVFIDGTIKPTPMQAWTTGRYIIKPGYILVNDHTGTAYEIMSVNPSLIKNYLIRQEVTFREVEQQDSIYKHIVREGEF